MGKAEIFFKVHFSVAIVLSDMGMHSNSTRSQGHLVTLSSGHSSVICLHFQRTFPLKLWGQFQLNFICSLLANGERKFILGAGHMTKMVYLLIYGKNSKKKPSQEPHGQLL